MPQGVYKPEGKEVINLSAKKRERTASWRITGSAAAALLPQLAGFRAPLQCPLNTSSAQHPRPALPRWASRLWLPRSSSGAETKEAEPQKCLVRGGWLWGTRVWGCLWHRGEAASSTAFSQGQFSLAFRGDGFALPCFWSWQTWET